MKRRRLKPEDRRAEIIDAATSVFVSQPYSNVSIAEIAEEAGASRALVTHYFVDKETLYAAVLANFVAKAKLTVSTDLDLPKEEIAAANLDTVLEFAEREKETVLALFEGGPVGRDPVITEAMERLRGGLIDRMMLNQFGTTDVPPKLRLAIVGFTGFAGVTIVDWLSNGAVTRDEVHELLMSTLRAVIDLAG